MNNVEQSNDQMDITNPVEEVGPNTKCLAINTLQEMGCHPEEMESGRIIFEYQGVTFMMEATDECLFVNLIWPWCHSFSKYDIDEFARVRKVVNKMN